jgi:hypothetical protein
VLSFLCVRVPSFLVCVNQSLALRQLFPMVRADDVARLACLQCLGQLVTVRNLFVAEAEAVFVRVAMDHLTIVLQCVFEDGTHPTGGSLLVKKAA